MLRTTGADPLLHRSLTIEASDVRRKRNRRATRDLLVVNFAVAVLMGQQHILNAVVGLAGQASALAVAAAVNGPAGAIMRDTRRWENPSSRRIGFGATADVFAIFRRRDVDPGSAPRAGTWRTPVNSPRHEWQPSRTGLPEP